MCLGCLWYNMYFKVISGFEITDLINNFEILVVAYISYSSCILHYTDLSQIFSYM